MLSISTCCRKFKYFPVGLFQAPSRFINEISLSRPKKEKYPLQYKVRVVNQDGSSYMTRYHLPVGIIRLPIDPNSLTEEQKKERLKRLRSEKKIEIKEYNEDVQFDRRALMNLMKKKRKK